MIFKKNKSKNQDKNLDNDIALSLDKEILNNLNNREKYLNNINI